MTNHTVIVVNDDMNNEIFKDMDTGTLMSREEFIQKIKDGVYPGYYVYEREGIKTPCTNLNPENLYGFH